MKVQEFRLQTCSDSGCNSLAAVQNAFRLINNSVDASVFTLTIFVIDVIDHVDKLLGCATLSPRRSTCERTTCCQAWQPRLLPGSEDSVWGPPPLPPPLVAPAGQRASSLNVSPSSCSRTAQHICFLYYVLLRRSLAATIFLCTFYPVFRETVCCSQQGTAAVTIISLFSCLGRVGWLYSQTDETNT